MPQVVNVPGSPIINIPDQEVIMPEPMGALVDNVSTPPHSRDSSSERWVILVNSWEPSVDLGEESDSGDTTISGDMHSGPRVRGPAPEEVHDPNHDLGDVQDVPVPGPSQSAGSSSSSKLPDVFVKKAAVVLKYTYDEYPKMKFTKDSSSDEE